MKTITINEDVKLPGTNVILEKGDRVRLVESVFQVGDQTLSDVCQVVQLFNQSYSKNKSIIKYSPALFKRLALLNLQSYSDRYAQEMDISELDGINMERPSSDLVQLAKSLDCYLYQLEGDAAKSDEAKALRLISDEFGSVIRVSKAYDAGYWGD